MKTSSRGGAAREAGGNTAKPRFGKEGSVSRREGQLFPVPLRGGVNEDKEVQLEVTI